MRRASLLGRRRMRERTTMLVVPVPERKYWRRESDLQQVPDM